MQDRFKFRCYWTDGNKEMFYYDTYYMPKLQKCEEEIAHIMQCTGLKDKNGKLIYESDIVLNNAGKWIIKYCDKCKSFQCFDFEDCCYSCSGDYTWAEFVSDRDEIEVIGNIYENKELLNEDI